MKRMHYLWRTRKMMLAAGPEWIAVNLRVRVEDSEKILVELMREDGTVILTETLGIDK